MPEIHCDLKHCGFTVESDDVQKLGRQALDHHVSMGMTDTQVGPMHLHTDFYEGEVLIVKCQSGKIIYLKGETHRPLRTPDNTSE